eukprot:TRINITY_DN3215_c0_g1_i1.p1 TRINITY_DN3215_c0_g1~~TRINITY_DN3215_c0_g1_i1.p1  ORF type:complete len:320 (-),score=78.94 TRINITY_DN3215_c0_g1_i1:730-1614(-)
MAEAGDAVVEGQVIGAPDQQVMGGNSIQTILGPKNAVLVKQTMRGCFQECLGCEAKSEFKISNMDWGYLDGNMVQEGKMELPDELYAIEQSSCCMRLCWRDGRGFTMQLSAGDGPGGAPLAEFRKPCGFPLQMDVPVPKLDGSGVTTCPVYCCCLLPELAAFDSAGRELGVSKYDCDLCLYVPKFTYSEGGKLVYKIRPETCCMGCCVVFTCGKNGCQVPFYFHNPETMEQITTPGSEEPPQIRKVWAGMKKECCSTADTFALFYPNGITPERKAALLGMTFLIDFTVFERQEE